MKKYSLLHFFYLPFFSADFYVDIALRWQGTFFQYLLLLVVISWLPTTVKVQSEIGKWVEKEAPQLVDQIPEIVIEDGEVFVDEEMPYFITDDTGDTVLVAIDTREEPVQFGTFGEKLMLTKNTLFFQKSETETRSFDLSNVDKFQFDKLRAYRILDFAKNFFAVLFYMAMVVFVFIYRIIQSLIYAAIGTFLGGDLKDKFEFSTFIRLAVVSLFPPTLLSALLDILGWDIPLWWPICFFIAMGYLYFALTSIQKELAGLSNQDVSA